MADNTQLPNGFTGFAFRKPAGGTSAADAIREREAQRAAHAGQPAPAQTPRRGGVNGFLTEREAASDAANEVRGAFQYNRDHEEAAASYSADGENTEGRVEFDDRIIDAFCMNMVIDPAQFDVVVFPNLYGDIASDLAAGLVGGLGIAPGANIGKDYAVFEAVHGSAPDIAGQNKANPTAEIMSAAMMLDHLGELEIAERIRRGVRAVYADGSVLTGDIRKATGSSAPAASCTEFTEALIAAIKDQA